PRRWPRSEVGVTLPAWLAWSAALGAVALFVYGADNYSKRVSVKRQGGYNRLLATCFPLLLLLLWELLVAGGYLNGRWFPPPTRIVRALWDLIVSYDRFNRTSLLG